MQKVNVAAGKISGFISKLRAVKETNYYHLKSVERTLCGGVGSREYRNIGIFWGGGDD
jgi:hypothetical protein